MANPENLKPNTERTPKERSELARKAGKASGKARRQRKEFRELLELALSQPNADNPEVDNWTVATAALLQKAMGGDVRAWEVMRDTLGQKPVEEIRADVSQDINIVIEE
jgi:hypothetical protein